MQQRQPGSTTPTTNKMRNMALTPTPGFSIITRQIQWFPKLEERRIKIPRVIVTTQQQQQEVVLSRTMAQNLALQALSLEKLPTNICQVPPIKAAPTRLSRADPIVRSLQAKRRDPLLPIGRFRWGRTLAHLCFPTGFLKAHRPPPKLHEVDIGYGY